jgi:hypothetical protein
MQGVIDVVQCDFSISGDAHINSWQILMVNPPKEVATHPLLNLWILNLTKSDGFSLWVQTPKFHDFLFDFFDSHFCRGDQNQYALYSSC